MIARAFSPGHITGFFQIHDEPEDPLKKGSRGAGVSLSQGVTTEVQITTANSMKIDIRINGQPVKSALVSEKVVSRFLDFSSGKKYQVKVSHEVGLPIGCGFGTSGAGALSLSLALNEALDIQISRIEAAQIAHIVEVESQTGLGTVIAETTGGVEIRVRPGAPGVGEILNLPISKDHVVACLTLGPIPTPSYLQDSQIRRRINEKGGFFTNALQNNPTITNFLTYSRQFAEHIRIPTKRVKSVFQDADAAGIICSTAIFGENVFTVIPSDQIQEIKAIFNRFEDSKHLSSIMEIDHRGARLLNE